MGLFFFEFLNRILIPTGLHHILGSFINFVFGEYVNPATGEVVHGDLNRFFAEDPTAGIFLTGFYPIMMFGLLGIILYFGIYDPSDHGFVTEGKANEYSRNGKMLTHQQVLKIISEK